MGRPARADPPGPRSRDAGVQDLAGGGGTSVRDKQNHSGHRLGVATIKAREIQIYYVGRRAGRTSPGSGGSFPDTVRVKVRGDCRGCCAPPPPVISLSEQTAAGWEKAVESKGRITPPPQTFGLMSK